MRHPSWSWGRVLGLGAVRLLLLPICPSLHGWIAQGSVKKRGDERLGSSALAVGAPWDTQSVGRARGTQNTQIPQRRAGGDARVMERRKVMTSRNVISSKPGEHIQLAPG